MSRLRVAILFGTKQNFDFNAFKYFILSVNQIQNYYEFFFPDVNNYVFTEGSREKVSWQSSLVTVSNFKVEQKIRCDHLVSIIANRFDNNFFFNTDSDNSVITTDVWEKQFSPPSLFEFLLHCIYSCLVYSKKSSSLINEDQVKIEIESHMDTRGCLADFTRHKSDDRIDIALGYICEEHEVAIQNYYGDEYLQDLKRVIERNWMGDLETKNSVAYNLKHIFKFNIFKDSGFNKTIWDKIKDKFHEIPGTLTGELVKFLIIVFLTYYFIKVGLMTKG